jgi:hypothetical protein
MEEILKQILEDQNTLLQRMGKLEDEISTMKEDMATKIQLDENAQMIKSIFHNTEAANAEIHALKLTTLSKEALSHLATKEDITKLNAKFEVLNSRLFQQEAELYELKAVK